MEPLEVIQTVFALAKAVKAQLDKVQANREKCDMLNRLIESLLRPIERLQGKADNNEDLRYFTSEMEKILEETRALFEKLSEKQGIVNKAKRFVKADSDEGKIDLIRQKLMDLNHNATYLTLIKLYENDHIKRANKESSWDVEFESVCYFCYVTPEGNIVIGGSYPEDENAYQLKAYDQSESELWNWECTPDMGQPADVASVPIDGEDYLAILCEGSGKVVLFNPIDHSLVSEPAYTIDSETERLRRIAHYDSHRLVVSVDPTWSAADTGKTSQVRVLRCESTTFTVIRSISIHNVIDTQALTFLSRASLAVVCGRHNNRIYVFDINDGHSTWHIHPQMVGESEVEPDGVCSIAGDLCVSDRSETRLVVATKDQWKKEELVEPRELGDQVYGLTWDKSTKRIIVLHEIKGRRRITMFNVET